MRVAARAVDVLLLSVVLEEETIRQLWFPNLASFSYWCFGINCANLDPVVLSRASRDEVLVAFVTVEMLQKVLAWLAPRGLVLGHRLFVGSQAICVGEGFFAECTRRNVYDRRHRMAITLLLSRDVTEACVGHIEVV